jgi:NADH-quinone oxidoreductase subunit H
MLRRSSCALAVALAAGSAATFSAGCAVELPPATLEIAEIQPREVDVGERIEIVGAGFPIRKTATVTFRGLVHRPGRPAERVVVTTEVEARSERRLEVPIAPAIAAPIVGHGDAAIHATFRGEIVVAFPAIEPGAARLVGRAQDLVIDLRPPPAEGRARGDLEQIGARTAEGLGLSLAAAETAAGGLAVRAVEPGSAAANAGIVPGDVLVDYDGVRVKGLADLQPGDETTAIVAVRAEGGGLREIVLDTSRCGPALSRAWIVALLGAAALAVAGLVGLGVVPGGDRFGRWVPQRGARHSIPASARARRALVETRRLLDGFAIGDGSAHATEGPRATLEIGLALSSVAVAAGAVEVARRVHGRDVDLLVVAAGLAGVLGSMRLLRAESGEARRRTSLVRTFVPGAAATAVAILETGGLRLGDLVRAQGAAPWQWSLWAGPATLLAAFGCLLALIDPHRNEGGAPERFAVGEGSTLPSATIAAFPFVYLFLGGGATPWAPASPTSAALAAAACVTVKVASLTWLVAALRAIVPRGRISTKTVVCAAVAAVASALVANVAPPVFALSSALRAVLLSLGVAALLVWIGQVVALRGRVTDERLDPRA